MSTEYNSKLIANLYEEGRTERASEIAYEMREIGDPIFIYPLHSAYKRFKDDFAAYNFITVLTSFKTPDAVEIIKEVVNDPKVEEGILEATMDYFIAIEHFDPKLVEKVNSIVTGRLVSGDVDGLLIGMLNYLLKASALSDLVIFLKMTFEDDEVSNEAREIALRFLLRADTSYIQHYLNHFDEIHGKKGEITLAKELLTWSKGSVPALKEKIRNEGSPRAKEIVQAEIDKNKQKEKVSEQEKQKAVEEKYTNADVISEIAQTRAKINGITMTDSRFNFQLFPSSELIYQQNMAAQSKQALIGYCIELRTFIQQFDSRIANETYTLEEMKTIVPDLEKPEGSINKFHVFLHKLALITTDQTVFGLRNVNKIVSKLAHPDNEDETIKLMREMGLDVLYTSEEWGKLHRRILEKYRDTLSSLQGALLTDRKD